MPIYPGQDIRELSYAARVEILLAALDDAQLLGDMSHGQRRDLRRAKDGLPDPDSAYLHMAIVSIYNRIVATAAEDGEYNEWELIRDEVMENDRHARPFYAALRLCVLLGAEITVWTTAEARQGEMRQMRALISLGKSELKIAEYWPGQPHRGRFPALETFELEPE